MQMKDETRVDGTKVFVAGVRDGSRFIAHLRVGEDWDAIGAQYLTRDQVEQLIALLSACLAETSA